MAKKLVLKSKLYEITTGLLPDDEDGEEQMNWARYHVLAGTMREAMAKVEANLDPDTTNEVITEARILCDDLVL